MHRARSKRTQIIRSAVGYSVMGVFIALGLTFAVLYVLGYRFNSEERSIDQGGLMQLETRPPGAIVTVDQRRLTSRTPTHHDVSAGTHTVRIEQDGYRPWQKTVSVEPGSVHWLNYPLMLPETLTPSAIRQFSSVDAVLPAIEEDRLVVLEDNAKPTFQIVDLAKPDAQTAITLPASSYPSDEGTYQLVSWSDNARYVLVSYTEERQQSWMILDTRDKNGFVDISSIVGGSQPLTKVRFIGDSNTLLYGMTGSSLRRINTNDKTLSAPLIEDVADYWTSKKGIVSYTTTRDKDSGSRSVGYYTTGAAQPRVIRTLYDDGTTPLRAVVGVYQDRYYIAIQNDDAVEVSQTNLPASDSTDDLSTAGIVTINTAQAADLLSFSPHERFVVAQYDSTFMTYDIELDGFTTTTLQGNQAVSGGLQWLDDYHVWSGRDNKLRIYEFDGENMQMIDKTIDGLAPTLSKNNRSLYLFRLSPAYPSQVELVKIPLRI